MQIYTGHIADIERESFFNGRIYVEKGRIVKIEKADDVEDCYIVPGLIDSHVHIESSMVSPVEFSRIAVSHGTVAVVCDPHEIANVLGVEGIDYMIEDSKKADLKFYFGCPSCVPSTEIETSGAVLNSTVVEGLLARPDIYFLSEMMNYPGVIKERKEVIGKINAAKSTNKKIDGHAPSLTGEDLYKYVNCGIETDHECFTYEEAKEKISLGMKIQIREGSAAKNLENLKKLLVEFPDKTMLCTDDCHPDELIKWHINKFFALTKKDNIEFFKVLKSATKIPCEHYNLNVGMLKEGDNADFIIIDNLDNFIVQKTIIDGKEVYNIAKGLKRAIKPSKIINNFNIEKIKKTDLYTFDEKVCSNIISVIDKELVTKKDNFNLETTENGFVANIENDILKIVVVNRYKNSKPAIGFIKNFGLKNGAVATSISHDSHNIIAVGTDDNFLLNAINRIIELKGGIVFLNDNESEFLQLDIAGIMSSDNVFNVAEKYCQIEKKIKSNGVILTSPLMTLSFMSLIVIPEIKISDKGLFDVKNFKLI